ncbi:MAG: acetylxylan esterase [bacterium]
MSESLEVLPGQDLSQMVFEHVRSLAQPLFERAREERLRLRTADDVAGRQKLVRQTFVRLIGGLPERTPLNPRRVGSLAREGYRVEKILFESRPWFYVPANLYLPAERSDPGPAVLVLCGHDPQGKAAEEHQRVARTLVRSGVAVLVCDPLGEGERSQYWERARERSRVGLGVPEHDYAGTQSLLVGRNLAAYSIWDAMRALDYLSLRDEVDVTRIGCAGVSAGGLMATCLFALDERVKAAVPVCAVSSREACLDAGLVADAEQVQDGVIEQGIDHADLCIAGAPRALRIAAARGDVLPLDGTRRTAEDVRRAYRLLHAEDRVDLVVAEGERGWSKPLRQAAYQWFHLWLGNPCRDSAEPPAEPELLEDLQCAPGGQVSNLGSRTVFSFTRDQARQLPPPAEALASRGEAETWQDELRGRLRELLRCAASSGAPKAEQHGAFFRGEMGVERLAFQSERGITIPALLFVPQKEGQWPGIVYVHEEGKEAEAGADGTAHMLASEGNAVLAIDVRGVGESVAGGDVQPDYRFAGRDGYHFYQYGMLGHTLVGRRVHDVLRSLALLAGRPEVDEEELSVVGEGYGGLLALFAAALDERIATAVCCRALLSYRVVATHEYHDYHPRSFVPGILETCDLPHVAAAVAPRRLVLAGPVDHMRRRVEREAAEEVYAPARAVYQLFDAAEALLISTDGGRP